MAKLTGMRTSRGISVMIAPMNGCNYRAMMAAAPAATAAAGAVKSPAVRLWEIVMNRR